MTDNQNPIPLPRPTIRRQPLKQPPKPVEQLPNVIQSNQAGPAYIIPPSYFEGAHSGSISGRIEHAGLPDHIIFAEPGQPEPAFGNMLGTVMATVDDLNYVKEAAALKQYTQSTRTPPSIAVKTIVVETSDPQIQEALDRLVDIQATPIRRPTVRAVPLSPGALQKQKQAEQAAEQAKYVSGVEGCGVKPVMGVAGGATQIPVELRFAYVVYLRMCMAREALQAAIMQYKTCIMLDGGAVLRQQENIEALMNQVQVQVDRSDEIVLRMRTMLGLEDTYGDVEWKEGLRARPEERRASREG